ncbi:MAG: hypothetical protein ACFFBS_05050 [Promethearchaeota archaeon]
MGKSKSISSVAVLFLMLAPIFLAGSVYGIEPGIQTENQWSPYYKFRRMVTITEPGISDRILEPVDVYLTFPQEQAIVNSCRVVYFNGTAWNEVTSQVWNETTYMDLGSTYYNSCTVTFLANVTESTQKIYYVYYDDANNTAPDYNSRIWAVVRNSSAPVDEYYPWIFDNSTGTNYTYSDLIEIRTPIANETASIILSDTTRPGSDWGGPVCGLITAKYNDSLALNTYDGYRASSFMFVGEFAIDPFNMDSTDASIYRVNVGPNNPAEAWIPEGGSVYIEQNGPLFVVIRIKTSDGGYENGAWTVNGTSVSYTGHTDSYYPSMIPANHGSGFFNYTYTYRFYYHGCNLLAELDQKIQVNVQIPGAGAYVKNYGDWPHVLTFTANSSVEAALQNQHAWYGSKYGLYNESSSSKRRDFPIEPWSAWYDNESGSDPSIGIITTNDTIGWEVLSLVVGGIGPNIMLQQILREGHQGDLYLMQNGTVFTYHYYIYTSAFGTNFTEIRNMAFQLNDPLSVSLKDSTVMTVAPSITPVMMIASEETAFTVNFTDPGTNELITNAMVEYHADWQPAGTWTIMFESTPGVSGEYQRNIAAPSDLGSHSITIRAVKSGYPTASHTIDAQILAKTTISGPLALSVLIGENKTVTVTLMRTDRGVQEPIDDANITISGWNGTHVVTPLGNGQYSVSFYTTGLDESDVGTYDVSVTASKTDYQNQTILIGVTVSSPPGQPVIVSFDWLIIIVLSAGLVSAVGYSLWSSYLRYPPIVRKIRKLHKAIRKDRPPAKSIDVKGRDVLVHETYRKTAGEPPKVSRKEVPEEPPIIVSHEPDVELSHPPPDEASPTEEVVEEMPPEETEGAPPAETEEIPRAEEPEPPPETTPEEE